LQSTVSHLHWSKLKVPLFKERECALLFIDILGFTKLVYRVMCEDESDKQPSCQAHSLELETQRHCSEDELRDVYVMFINPRIDATLTTSLSEP